MNEKINPLTCELQVGDVCEVLRSSMNLKQGEIAVIENIEGPVNAYFLRTKCGRASWRDRSELRLISRNGKPIEEQWQPKSGETVWCDGFGKILIVTGKKDNNGKCVWCNFLEDGILDVTFPVPLSELEPYTWQDKPVIDFGKSGLVLTDGNYILRTTGETDDFFFEANSVLPPYATGMFTKNNPWRDITAEAQPLLEQLKTLMHGK